MKKRKFIVFLASLFITCIFTLSACENIESTSIEQPQTCQHQWVEADCLYPKTCRLCNETEGTALGHTEVIDEAIEPTCTTAGLTEGKHCGSCNKILVAQQTINALGHNYESMVTSPTCTEKGYTTHTCSLCSDTKVDTYTNANGHTEVVDKAVSPTCTKTGLTEGKHCSVCGEVLVKQQTVNALGHDWGNPTCTTPRSCCVCFAVDPNSEPLGHSYVQGECRICGANDPNFTNPYESLAQYVLNNGDYNGEGWYFIKYTLLHDNDEYRFCIFTDEIATSLSFVLYTYVSNSDSYVEIYLNKDTDVQDVYIWNESSGHITTAYGSIYKSTFGNSNYIYDYEYYGDYSSLSSKFKELFKSYLTILLEGVSTYLLPDHINMEMLGFVNY